MHRIWINILCKIIRKTLPRGIIKIIKNVFTTGLDLKSSSVRYHNVKYKLQAEYSTNK